MGAFAIQVGPLGWEMVRGRSQSGLGMTALFGTARQGMTPVLQPTNLIVTERKPSGVMTRAKPETFVTLIALIGGPVITRPGSAPATMDTSARLVTRWMHWHKNRL